MCSLCDDLKLVKSTLPHAICQPRGIEGLDEYGRVTSPTIFEHVLAYGQSGNPRHTHTDLYIYIYIYIETDR